MHWLPSASLLWQCGGALAIGWLWRRRQQQAAAALALAEAFLEQRDGLAWWLSLQGWQVDLEDGVRIWWPEGDPEEERLAR